MKRQRPRPEDLFHSQMNHPVETLANLESVPIREGGEPLVDLRAACPRLLIGVQPRFARHSVAERLNMAQQALESAHPGYRLRVGEAYRPVDKQARFFLLARLVARLLHPFWPPQLQREAAAKYVADPKALAPPPHTTGGAVDVGLMTPAGRRAYMGPFTIAAAHAHCPDLPEQAHFHRKMLGEVMEQAGFSNYEEEWWHWSYGDSGWALRTGQPYAFYGQAEPPNF